VKNIIVTLVCKVLSPQRTQVTGMNAVRISLFLIVLPLFFCACGDRGSDPNSVQLDKMAICETDGICMKYLDVWLEEFMQRNSMSAEYFLQHVKVNKAWIQSWNDAETLIIGYTVSIEWANIDVRDNVDVLLKYNFEPLNIVRNKYLTPAQISALLDHPTNIGAITPVLSLEYLKFKNFKDAMEALKRAADTDSMRFDRLSYYVPGMIPRENGYPYLFGSGVVDYSANECMSGQLNLFTGEMNIYYEPCWVN
jgi:hypothetical protein